MSEGPEVPVGGLARLGVMLEMIKFQHTIFALPFAVMSAALASEQHPVSWKVYAWILAAMVSARSAAMAFNRLVDQEIDARNPRTSGRALPQGTLDRSTVWVFTLVCCLTFMLAARSLNPLAFLLAPFTLVVILGYSLTKRFTWLSHWVLGFALGIAPVGAWIAITGRFAAAPLLLALAVTCWTAGFDIIYSCQDTEFDEENGLHSISQRFGKKRALQISSLLHVVMIGCLIALPRVAPLGWIYEAGVGACAALLVYEHSIVKPHDFSRVDAAFFTTNGLVSAGLAVFLLLDLACR